MVQQTKFKGDIHNFERRLERATLRLEKELSPENLLLARRYHNAMIMDTAGKAVQEKHLQTILSLNKMYQRNWQEITKQDVEDLVVQIIKKYSNEKGQETHTSFDYKKILKIFVRWVKTGSRKKNPDAPEPVEIRGLVLKKVKDRLSREELITDKDRDLLLNACEENIRDKAMISVHGEAGSRIGETLTLQIKHVVFDGIGAIIKVDGKTNARPIRLVKSLPYLAAWLNAHPDKNNPNAPLWVNEKGKQITYGTVQYMLTKRVKKAGLEKRIYPQLFRHSEITESANYLTEAQLRKRHGWTGSSRMPERYTHLIDSDVDKAVLGHYGLVKEELDVSKHIPKICTTCKECNTVFTLMKVLKFT